MSMFFCEHHQRFEDSDYVGCEEAVTGQVTCTEGALDVQAQQDIEREHLTLARQREALSGACGGGDADD